MYPTQRAIFAHTTDPAGKTSCTPTFSLSLDHPRTTQTSSIHVVVTFIITDSKPDDMVEPLHCSLTCPTRHDEARTNEIGFKCPGPGAKERETTRREIVGKEREGNWGWRARGQPNRPSLMGGGDEMGGATAAGKEKSSFAVTCSLLSQFLKEKKTGGLHGLALGMPPAAVVGGGAFRPPTTMNLLSGLDTAETAAEPPLKAPVDQQLSDKNAREADGEQAQQLTIFYGGKVVVFDNFPATKVKDLLQIVNAGDAVNKNIGTAATQSMPRPAQNNLPDLPIARRNSLHRFLEKRKGRMNTNAPYQANSSVAPSKQANGEKSLVGFGQEVTIKHEI
uniref:Protein TIFY n=1 Tax=Leersia perrieri TaxID=77586 RepID=A0A0D9XE41_9ORYZ